MKSLFGLCVLLALAVTSLSAMDISGAWNFSVETDAGSGNPNFVFKQEGEKLTGHYSGLFGKADVTGAVKGDQVEFQFKASYGGQDFVVKYSGSIQSPSNMKGAVYFGDLGSGTWTAKKKE